MLQLQHARDCDLPQIDILFLQRSQAKNLKVDIKTFLTRVQELRA